MNYTARVVRPGPEVVLYERRSESQHVLLERDADGFISLTIDGHWQFSSRDEGIFHEMLADLPMVFAPRVARVLILGGGDGLALRNVLRYPGVQEVLLCELDAGVIEMARDVPEMVHLCEDAFADPRVRVQLGDAREWVNGRLTLNDAPRFDVVICDFPACTDARLERLFDREFYAKVAGLMHEESVLSVQVSQDPPGFWGVVDSGLSPNFAFTWPSLVALGDPDSPGTDWADFSLAAHERLRVRRALARTETRSLVDGELEAYRITNRDRARFETGRYGDKPDFSESW
jgi:spermidine synthase